jgi:hypothetical protein
LAIFGATAVSLMALAYALERRHHAFIALFAIACALSSAYGFLIGSLPFGSAEALWTLVALQRFCAAETTRRAGWRSIRSRTSLGAEEACDRFDVDGIDAIEPSIRKAWTQSSMW